MVVAKLRKTLTLDEVCKLIARPFVLNAHLQFRLVNLDDERRRRRLPSGPRAGQPKGLDLIEQWPGHGYGRRRHLCLRGSGSEQLSDGAKVSARPLRPSAEKSRPCPLNDYDAFKRSKDVVLSIDGRWRGQEYCAFLCMFCSMEGGLDTTHERWLFLQLKLNHQSSISSSSASFAFRPASC